MPLAAALAESFAPDDLLAVSDAGYLPFRSGMRTLDLWGLSDRRIATRGFSSDYVMGLRPSVVVLNSFDGTRFVGREAYDRALYPRLAERPDLRLRARVPYGPFYYLWVFADRPLAPPAGASPAAVGAASGR